MGEAFNDVTLKLSLQVDGQRLEPLDTSRLDASLADAERRIKASGAAAAAEYQRQLDSIRFSGPRGTGGTAAVVGGGIAAAGRNAARSFDTFLDRGFGPANRDADLRLAPINGSELIGRRAPDDSQRLAALDDASRKAAGGQKYLADATEQTFLYMQRSRGEIERIIRVQDQQSRIEAVSIEQNIRLAGTLGKVSNAAAIAVVGYRALTQVNGEHVNALGQYEGSLESSAIGLSLFARGASTAVSLLAKFGIAVTAGSTALAAIPFAVAVGGFKLLANAKAELARQEQINLVLDERIAAGNEARRQRELAAERVWVDAMIGLRKRLADSAPQRLARDLDTRNRQIGLTTDPAQRQREFAEEEDRLTKLREGKQLASRRAGVDYQRAKQADDPKAAADALERQKRINEEIAALEQRKTAAIEGQRAAAKEIADGKRQELVDERSEAARKERQQESFSGLSRVEQLRRTAKGKAPEAPERSTTEIDAEISKLDASFKKRDEAFVSLLKQQAGFENTFADSVDDAASRFEAMGDAMEKMLATLNKVADKLAASNKATGDKLEDLGFRVARNGRRVPGANQ